MEEAITNEILRDEPKRTKKPVNDDPKDLENEVDADEDDDLFPGNLIAGIAGDEAEEMMKALTAMGPSSRKHKRTRANEMSENLW